MTKKRTGPLWSSAPVIGKGGEPEIAPIVRCPPKFARAGHDDAFLDSLTGTPPTDADEQSSHDDLRRASAAALWRELAFVYLRLALDDCPHPWWVGRSWRIREELRSRDCPTG
jgi:hypothetical protein